MLTHALVEQLQVRLNPGLMPHLSLSLWQEALCEVASGLQYPQAYVHIGGDLTSKSPQYTPVTGSHS